MQLHDRNDFLFFTLNDKSSLKWQKKFDVILLIFWCFAHDLQKVSKWLLILFTTLHALLIKQPNTGDGCISLVCTIPQPHTCLPQTHFYFDPSGNHRLSPPNGINVPYLKNHSDIATAMPDIVKYFRMLVLCHFYFSFYVLCKYLRGFTSYFSYSLAACFRRRSDCNKWGSAICILKIALCRINANLQE